jgi:3-isopropylmalate dehydrogenase
MPSSLASPDARWLTSIVGSSHPALGARDEIVVGILPGEGVGPALTAATVRVLHALADVHALPVRIVDGPPARGTTLSAAEVAFFRSVLADGGAVLAGAVGGRFVYELRRELDLFCKLVPVHPWAPLARTSPLVAAHGRDVDLVLVRENVAGLYQGVSRTDDDGGDRRVEHTFGYRASEVTRIVRVAADLAARRRGELAVVVKDGGLPAMSALWRDCTRAVCEPLGLRPRFADIDLCAYQLVHAPSTFDVVVAPNLYGDVLADLSALLLGGRGLSYSGNFAPTGAAVYQTNHGAAFDLVDSDTANPLGQISALAMLLRESAGAPHAAQALYAAIDDVLRAGWRTRDVAAPGDRVVGTRAMTDAIIAAIERGGRAAVRA